MVELTGVRSSKMILAHYVLVRTFPTGLQMLGKLLPEEVKYIDYVVASITIGELDGNHIDR